MRWSGILSKNTKQHKYSRFLLDTDRNRQWADGPLVSNIEFTFFLALIDF